MNFLENKENIYHHLEQFYDRVIYIHKTDPDKPINKIAQAYVDEQADMQKAMDEYFPTRLRTTVTLKKK